MLFLFFNNASALRAVNVGLHRLKRHQFRCHLCRVLSDLLTHFLEFLHHFRHDLLVIRFPALHFFNAVIHVRCKNRVGNVKILYGFNIVLSFIGNIKCVLFLFHIARLNDVFDNRRAGCRRADALRVCKGFFQLFVLNLRCNIPHGVD